jgi:hypothetical protein
MSDSSDEEFFFGNFARRPPISRMLQRFIRPTLFRQNAMPPQVAPQVPLATATNLEKDWECSICLSEQDERRIVLHPCLNNHTFHHECIVEWMMRDKRCPICRGIAPEPEPIYAGLRRVPISNDDCATCGLRIDASHMQIIQCGHHLHIHCALDSIIDRGINHDGLLRCHRCEQL